MSLSKHIKKFADWLKIEKGYSEHTIAGYTRDLNEFHSITGEVVINEISSDYC